MFKRRNIEKEIEALLADESHAGHPLRQSLADLYEEFRSQARQLERITRISDRYQNAAQRTNLSLKQHCQRQLKYLEKIVRISDGYQMLMRQRQETLEEESLQDSLTGLGNRRMLQNRLKSEVFRLERHGRPLTLAMVDVDRFKAINDIYGHDVGDQVLIAVARSFEANLRDYDVCGRWGGEEFLVIMPELDAAMASQIVERLRQAVAATEIRAGEQSLRITASFGIAQHRWCDDVSETLNRADKAMLVAKRTGRNCCKTAP